MLLLLLLLLLLRRSHTEWPSLQRDDGESGQRRLKLLVRAEVDEAEALGAACQPVAHYAHRHDAAVDHVRKHEAAQLVLTHGPRQVADKEGARRHS